MFTVTKKELRLRISHTTQDSSVCKFVIITATQVLCINFKGTKNMNSSSTPVKNLTYFALATLVIVAFSDQLQAIPLETLREPMKKMKKEVWSYMYVIKVAATVVGGVFSVLQQSLLPLGVGAGITAGITFFDEVVGDGSTALIG